MSAETLPTRPLLRYFGGKWQLRKWIISHFPDHLFYAEPFAGAASVLIAKPPASGGEIINDLNGDLINLFRVMQCPSMGDELQRRLDWTLYAQSELHIAREKTSEPVESARRMLVRSFMGIASSGVAGTASGFRMGTVDLSRLGQDERRTFRNCAKDWVNWKSALHLIRARLAKVMIYQRDALDFIRLMDSPDCLLYVDPPYHTSARGKTRYLVEFSAHAGLVALLIASRSKVVLSGYDCAEYEPLKSAGWTRVEKDYRANMSQRRRTEVLWKNPACENAQI